MNRTLISLLLVCHLACNPVLAGLSYSDGTVTGKANTNKVGSLFANDLLVVISGPKLTVEQRSARKRVASGTVFKTSLNGERVVGFCYFNSGDRLAEVLGKDAGARDVVELRSGEQIACKIESLEQEIIKIIFDGSQKLIAMSEVVSVKSPNVFYFSAKEGPLDQVDRLEFTPTCDKALARKLDRQAENVGIRSSEGAPVTEKVIGFAVGMISMTALAGLVLPIAIAIPINKYREKMRNRRNSQQAEFLVRRYAPRRNNNNN